MSQSTDPSEHPSQQSSEHPSEPSEHSVSGNHNSRPHTIIEEHDSSDDSDASSRRTTARSIARVPVYGPQTRRTFRIPSRDEAGPSQVRDRSVTPPPPSKVRAPEALLLGMTPHERFMFSGMTDDILMHRMRLGSQDYAIGVIQNILAANDDIMGNTLEGLARAGASIHQLYILVYLLAMMIVILGWMILWFGH